MTDLDLFYKLYEREKRRRENIADEYDAYCVGAPDGLLDPWEISAVAKKEYDAIMQTCTEGK